MNYQQLAGLHGSSIIISLCSALIFLFILFLFFRPWFIVSKKISRENNVFKFKIINLTLTTCTDLNIHLRQVKELDAFPKGRDVEYKLLPVHTSSFIYVSGFFKGVLSGYFANCLQVRADQNDLKSIIEDNGTYLELIITSRHGISSLQRTIKKTYKHAGYVKDGKFNSGMSFEIVNPNN